MAKDIKDWSVIDVDNQFPAVDGGAAEGWTGKEVNDAARARMGAHARYAQDPTYYDIFTGFAPLQLKDFDATGPIGNTLVVSPINEQGIQDQAYFNALFPAGARLAIEHAGGIEYCFVRSVVLSSGALTFTLQGNRLLDATAYTGAKLYTDREVSNAAVGAENSKRRATFVEVSDEANRNNAVGSDAAGTAIAMGLPRGALWYNNEDSVIQIWDEAEDSQEQATDANTGWRSLGAKDTFKNPGDLRVHTNSGDFSPTVDGGTLSVREAAGVSGDFTDEKFGKFRADIAGVRTLVEHYPSTGDVFGSPVATIELNDAGQVLINGASLAVRSTFRKTVNSVIAIPNSTVFVGIPEFTDLTIPPGMITATLIKVSAWIAFARAGNNVDNIAFFVSDVPFVDGLADGSTLVANLDCNNGHSGASVTDFRLLNPEIFVDPTVLPSNATLMTWALKRSSGASSQNCGVGGAPVSGAAAAFLGGIRGSDSVTVDSANIDDEMVQSFFTLEVVA